MYEEMKKKFDTGDYICMMVPKFSDRNLNSWVMRKNPVFIHDYKYALIHKKHKDILYAFFKGEEIEIYAGLNRGVWKREYSFISDYDEQFRYRLKLTNEDKEEISEQIDNINETIENLKFKVVNSAILVGTGKDIANNIGNHLNKNNEYEIIIKQIKP